LSRRTDLAELRPQLDLAQETTGLDRISNTLVSAYDRVDIVALTDTHSEEDRFRSKAGSRSITGVQQESAPHHR
jgi:hypothetical protein